MKIIWNSQKDKAVVKERVVGFEVSEPIEAMGEGSLSRPGEPGLLVVTLMGYDSPGGGVVFEVAMTQEELDAFVSRFVYAMEVD